MCWIHLLWGDRVWAKNNWQTKAKHTNKKIRKGVAAAPSVVYEIGVFSLGSPEVSTPHFNDRVRMEKEYGVGGHAEGLPTTSMEEIEER